MAATCRLLITLLPVALAAQTTAVEFNRDIRSIFSDKCYACHGPDAANRKTKLRFDTEAGAKQNLGGHFALVGGDTAKSSILRRITTDNPALRMPPVYSRAAKLGEREIELIRRWVEQGAKWQKHWSLIAPVRPTPPAGAPHPIDAFVRERLKLAGLSSSPEADRATLIRRVTLDLTGLPPTPAEAAAFLADRSPEAYERVVDRLLASPRYGERMAARWLDAARYADTNGYQSDAERFMWRWRDWVIDAFNRNLSFDRFTVEQIAGDLLPNATLDQRIATGFNRNHRGNGEGGIIPEEYAVEYVVDRVDTTATVWLGLTMGCARCHDHKYDPISQKEFYQFYAYFNNVPERGKAFKYGNSPPLVAAPTPAEEAKLKDLDVALAEAERRFESLKPELARAQRDWEKTLDRTKPIAWSITADMVAHDPKEQSFDGKRVVDLGDKGNFGFYDKFTLAAWVYPEASTGAIITRTADVAESDGYGLYLKDGKVQATMVQRWLDDGGRVETERTLELNRWHHVLMTYDGSRFAAGIRVYVDGEKQKVKVLLDDLNQSFAVKEPLRVGSGGGPENRFRGRIEDVRVYSTALSDADAKIVATRDTLESPKLAAYYLDQQAPPHIREAAKRLRDVRKQRTLLLESFSTVMVMEERPTPRDTFMLVRGAYDHPGEKVTRGLPGVFPALPKNAPNNRLGLARWLVDPSNPLTARVTVNRFWQMYFGTGLVKTAEDFGSQGEWPSHPALLDWLATEFIRTGWDVKALQKTIVTSATYKQSSKVTPELLQKDPENRLLARGARFRLPAETVRDQALAVAGLLVEKIGGPSVKPYQPAGLWKELAGGADYKQGSGENLYRRSLYTFWKRAVAPPGMMLFDSAGREACTVRETRTNTPLQALTLMNDVTYVEAARMLGQRMMREGGDRPEERIGFGFKLATSRMPSPSESSVLLNAFYHHRDRYQTDRDAAVKLVSQGESRHDEKLDSSELAAYATVASMILNLDETITKE